jgi:hypothetical protein
MFLVPAVYLPIHAWQERRTNERQGAEA